MKVHCPICVEDTEIVTISEPEEMEIRGEKIVVEMKYYRCEECGEEFHIVTKDDDPFAAAYREYRRRKGWVQPEEIKAFREKLGLTQGQFSDLLGIGIATLNRYENGALQTDSNNQLLRLCIEDPDNLIQLMDAHPEALAEPERERLITIIKEKKNQNNLLIQALVEQYCSYPPGINNGGKLFDFNKFSEVVKFFCRGKGVFKSKLLKELFYTDFKHYKEYGTSITGACYKHLDFGPVPDYYETWLAANIDWFNSLRSEERDFQTYTGEVLISDEEPDFSLFTQEEQETLFFVQNQFKDMTSRSIEDFSHQETGYIQTKDKQTIPYTFAKDLQI